MALDDNEKNQARVILNRMFEFGTEGRVLCRFLTAELGKGEAGDYQAVKRDLLEELSRLLDKLYLSPPPKMSS